VVFSMTLFIIFLFGAAHKTKGVKSSLDSPSGRA